MLSEISSWITSSSEAFPCSQCALHSPPCFPHLHLILLQVWSLSSHDPSSWEGRQSVPCLCGCHHCCFFLLQWTINNPLLWEESWQLWFSPFFSRQRKPEFYYTDRINIQINNKNTLTISCYHCKFSILNLPDTLSRNLGSTFCFLILVLQYLCGQTKTAMLIQTERFHRKNG